MNTTVVETVDQIHKRQKGYISPNGDESVDEYWCFLVILIELVMVTRYIK